MLILILLMKQIVIILTIQSEIINSSPFPYCKNKLQEINLYPTLNEMFYIDSSDFFDGFNLQLSSTDKN